MASIKDYAICTICGIIICQSEWPGDIGDDPSLEYRLEWRGLPIALSGPYYGPRVFTAEALNVREEQIQARVAGIDGFRGHLIIQDGPTVTPQMEIVRDADGQEIWFFGLHSACLDIAQRVMQTSRVASIRTMRDLWVTLDRRCARSDYEHFRVTSFLPCIPDNRRGEPLKLNLRRYYVPDDHIRNIDEADEEAVDWVRVNLSDDPKLRH